MAKETLGRNITFPIYNENGTSFHNLVLKRAVVDSVVMSLGDKITGDVYYKDNALDVTMREYILYKKNPDDENEDAVKYVLVSPPTIVREGMVSDNSELKGMTKYSFVFYHPMYVLNNIPFSDIAVTSEQERYLSQNKEFSWIGYPDDYIAKISKNLQQTQWTVEKSSRFPTDKDSVLSGVLSFSNNTIADALKTWYDTWEIPYVIDVVKSGEQGYSNGKRFKIVFGLPSTEIYQQDGSTPFVFEMGKGVGLKNNSRTPRNNKIVTRISGYGSESNIPYGYPQIIWTGDQSWDYTINNASGMQTITVGSRTIQAMSYPIYDGIVGGQKVRLIKHPFTRTHLMPTVYSDTVNKKVNPLNPNYNPNGEIIDYYDAIATQEYQYPNEIDQNSPSYEIHEFDVKPEMSDDGEDIEIVNAVPLNADLTPADSWDDSIDDDGNFLQSYFRLDLPILPFDLYACASITEEMSVNMRSGACIGCTFNVQVDWEEYKRNFYKEDGTFDPVIHTESGDGHVRDGSRFPDSSQTAISLIVQKDNETFGTIMPNVYQQPHSGDAFVVLGISLPVEYITNAEETLDDEMKSYMLENNVHYYDYPLKFDEYFLATHTNILTQLKPNAIVKFKFGDSQQPLELYVKQLTIKYGQNVLPQYDITLTDNVEVVLNQIGQVADDVERLSSIISMMRENYSRNVWSEIAKKLSKVSDDTAKGKITFEKGAEFGTYNSGALGSGGAINIDQNGNSNAEFDFLTIRKAATFRTITILELKHVGGELGLTAGAMKVSAVEETENDYRCYFDTSDGTKQVYQEFVVGDQARCQQFRLAQNASGMTTTHYYWRLVTGVGTNYVDLSKTDADTGSGIPQAGDEVIQLGYRNNDHPERQSAIILSAVETQAPSIKYYQGINSYNLTNAIVKEDYYDPTTSLYHSNTYGESYVGDKNETTYMKYTQNGGVEIKGKVEMSSASTLDGNNLGSVLTAITGTATTANTNAQNAQTAAGNAQSAADAAQSTANTANTNATNAQTAASNAQSTADAANTAASKAATAAQTAQTAANNAQTAANNAQSSADQANTTANATATTVANLSTGNQNLLRNSGFTGDYLPENSATSVEVNDGTFLFSNPFDHWTTTNATAISSVESVTGMAVVLTNGSLQQTLETPLIANGNYIFSFKAKGTSISFTIGSYSYTQALTNTATRYTFKFVAQSASTAFAITSSTCTVMELQLVQGTVPNTDWINNPNDNDKALAYFQNLTYLTNAIVNGSTSILGGLILSNQIRVGNYRDGSMVQETGGIASQSSYTFEESGGTSGLYTGSNSPFLWGGGTMEKAFYTIAKYDENPNYEPTASELANLMAQFVVTHGGRAILNDIIARGVIIATSGIFKNIASPNGNFQIDANGDMKVRNATISGNMYAPLLVLNSNNIDNYTTINQQGFRVLDLEKTGLNICLENINIGRIELPILEKYKGAVFRLFNNTDWSVSVSNTVVSTRQYIGTYHNIGSAERVFASVAPYCYIELQCQLFNAGSYSTQTFESTIRHIDESNDFTEIASGLQVGDIIHISAGVEYGREGYQVKGGTSASSLTKTFFDTTGASSTFYKVIGNEIDYTVVSSPSTPKIFAKIANGTLAVSVEQRNKNSAYRWLVVSETSYKKGVPEFPYDMSFFHVSRGGGDVGHEPYITDDGYIRFRHWERQADDGAIYVDG